MVRTCDQVPIVFFTEKLRGEKVNQKHVLHLKQIISDQKIQAIYNTTNETRFSNIASQLSIINKQWKQYGYGLYCIFDNETSEHIGFAGYHTSIINEYNKIDCFNYDKQDQELELYIFLMPKHWRKGYGSQVMRHLINLAFKYLVYRSIIAYIEPNNIASIKLIKKLGFIEEKEVIYNNRIHNLYRLYKL
jgi:RimJ/RimL family protein N-acetyltransferase